MVAEHMRYYHRQWNFGQVFEATIAHGVGDFFRRYDERLDRAFWSIDGDVPVATLVVDGSDLGLETGMAHVRWFIIADAARGAGLGRRLMDEAMAFIREAGYERCYLTTFSGLDAARHLYESHGFTLTEEGEDMTWGVPILEQRFDWHREGA